MKTFNDLEFKSMPHIPGGIQAIIKFDNSFGASVVQHSYSYGGDAGYYELAVLDKDDSLCYDTEVTDDVLGWLTENDVTEALIKIQNLK